MASLLFYKRQWLRALEYARSIHGTHADFQIHNRVYGREVGKFEKTARVLSSIKSKLPQVFSKHGVKLPRITSAHVTMFNPDDVVCVGKIACGGGLDVYLFSPTNQNEPSYVFKVCYEEIFTHGSLKQKIAFLLDEYNKMSHIYTETLPGLIPAEEIVETIHPLDGLETYAVIQKFYGHETKDIFHSFTNAELKELTRSAPSLAKEIADFVRLTKDNLEKTGEIIDILGDNNLVIVHEGGTPRLKMIDSHGTYIFDEIPKFKQRGITKRLTWLEQLT